MTVPVVTFFNNKGGVGKTSLVYHLAWMLSELELDHRVLACDLDPQSNLTAMFLDEDQLEALYEGANSKADLPSSHTIFECVKPLMKVGDWTPPTLQNISDNLKLIPGDLALASFEDLLSAEWPKAMDSTSLYRPFRVLTAFSAIMQDGARQMDASIVLADVGPNLGAINRSALIATDYVVVPVGTDLFSLRGLRNLGPTLRAWRKDWRKRLDNWPKPDFALPAGRMEPIGYVAQQHSVRLNRPVRAYDMWINRIPEEYAKQLLDDTEGPYPETPALDKSALATIKHYRSLVPLAQEARKPIFQLTAADGAIGGHAKAAYNSYDDFRNLAQEILRRIQDP